MTTLRAIILLLGFFALTLPLIPVQAALLRFFPTHARRLPHWYHRQVCRLLGVNLSVNGHVDQSRPVLLVANHTSWLDIPVLSAVAPVSFVAKQEVSSWPFVSWLARLQRTVFINREKRGDVGRAMNVMLDRLANGDSIVLFPEGTSSDGNRVLNFRTSLFAAAKPPEKFARSLDQEVVVQTVAVVYRHLHGVPLSRAERTMVSWYGDMDMLSHAWNYLKAGPLDVEVAVGVPQPLDNYKDRKDLARRTEDDVRGHVMRTLRGLPHDSDVLVATPAVQIEPVFAAQVRPGPAAQSGGQPGNTEAGRRSRKWR